MRLSLKLVMRAAAALSVCALLVGFRVFPYHWNISKGEPTLWVRVCSSSLTIENHNYPSGDPLAGQSPSFQQVVQSVIDDINNVPTSYIRLAPYPADPNNPGTALPGDSTFTLNRASERTIDICFDGTSSTAGLSAGHATPKEKGGRYVGCEIKGKPESAKSGKFLVSLITHELGHCLGLGHNFESTKSVMSYFSSEDIIRLQNDDRAGLTYHYPEDSGMAAEQLTFGLGGCDPK